MVPFGYASLVSHSILVVSKRISVIFPLPVRASREHFLPDSLPDLCHEMPLLGRPDLVFVSLDHQQDPRFLQAGVSAEMLL